MDFGCVKIPNKSPITDKTNREFEDEISRTDSSGSPVTVLILVYRPQELRTVDFLQEKYGLDVIKSLVKK